MKKVLGGILVVAGCEWGVTGVLALMEETVHRKPWSAIVSLASGAAFLGTFMLWAGIRLLTRRPHRDVAGL